MSKDFTYKTAEQAGNVTKLVVDSDNENVKKGLAEPYHEFSDEWRNACRALLSHYLDYKKDLGPKAFRNSDLYRMVMEPHHHRDKKGRVTKINNRLSRNDFNHFLSGIRIGPAKFRYIDYFCNELIKWDLDNDVGLSRDTIFEIESEKAKLFSSLFDIHAKEVFFRSQKDFTLCNYEKDDGIELVPVFIRLIFLNQLHGIIRITFLDRSKVPNFEKISDTFILSGYFHSSGLSQKSGNISSVVLNCLLKNEYPRFYGEKISKNHKRSLLPIHSFPKLTYTMRSNDDACGAVDESCDLIFDAERPPVNIFRSSSKNRVTAPSFDFNLYCRGSDRFSRDVKYIVDQIVSLNDEYINREIL